MLFSNFYDAEAQSMQGEPYGMDISNLHIQSIAQDSVGYVWMATARGLNRIDAYKKSNFYFHTSSPTSLCDDNLYDLYVTREGKLIAFTRWGVNIYNRFNNNFVRLKGDNPIAGFSCAEQARDGKVWLGVASPNLMAYADLTDNSIHQLYVPWLNGKIETIVCDDSGLLWLSLAQNQGVCIFNPYTRRLVRRLNNIEGVFKSPYKQVLYAHTKDHRIVLLNTRSLKMTRLVCQLPHDVVMMDVTADKRFYFLTHDMTLSIYNTHLRTFDKRMITGVNNVYNITSLMVDHQKNIWVGTFEEGYRFIPVAKRTFDVDAPLAEHFRNQFVTFMTGDGKDRFWIATRHSGLHEFDRRTNTDKMLLNLHLTNEECAIACCFHDSRKRLWAATVKALYCYDTQKGTTLTHKYTNIMKSRYVTEDRNGNIWAICEGNGGIWMLPTLSQGGFRRAFASSIASNANITYLMQLRSGRYLFSSYGDNVYLADARGHVEPLFKNCTPRVTSFLRSVIYLYEDSRHVLWLGTYGSGLMSYDVLHKKIRVYTMANGLPSNDILSIVEEPSHHVLWLSTSYGLSKLAGGSFMNYFAKNGLLGNQYHERATYSCNGVLYFTGNHGITSFSPRNISNTHYSIPFGIESITTDAGTYFTASLAEKLKLRYNENSFTVSFMGFDYATANSLQYSYILEGYDKQWSIPSTTHIVKFSDLPSGSYLLKVKVADNSGCWSSRTATLRIVIPPAPWATWWAILIYIVLTAYMVYLAMRFYIRYRVDKEKIKLSEVTLSKERELNQAKINFFENVSHELRTPLGLIYGPFCELLKQGNFGKKENEYMLLMGANIERLMILIEQILSFSHLGSETLSLSVARRDVVAIVWKVLKRFRGANEEKHIETSFSSTDEHLVMYADEDKLDKILTNLLSNAFKYTPSGGKILLSLKIHPAADICDMFGQSEVPYSNYVLISVTDSGMGIAPDETDKIFDRFYRSASGNNTSIGGSGIGLYYTRCLVKKHKGFIKAQCNATQGGSTFMFCLPLSDAAYSVSEKKKYDGQVVADDASTMNIESIASTSQVVQDDIVPSASDDDNNKPLLLIVEDEPGMQSFLSSMLQADYNIHKAFDGGEGLEMAQKIVPDIILMDVMMPVMNGYVLCDRLKNDISTCHIPIVMLTAKGSIDERIEGVRAGADVYISKPFNPDYLKSVVQGVILNRRRMQHLIADCGQADNSVEKKEAVAHLSKIDRELLTHLDEKIEAELNNSELAVDDLACELNLSRSTFYRKIKSLTGCSPNDYIRVYRVKKAAQLIENDEYNLAEIADMTGFGTQSYFSAIFKKHFGMTPSEYKVKAMERK